MFLEHNSISTQCHVIRDCILYGVELNFRYYTSIHGVTHANTHSSLCLLCVLVCPSKKKKKFNILEMWLKMTAAKTIGYNHQCSKYGSLSLNQINCIPFDRHKFSYYKLCKYRTKKRQQSINLQWMKAHKRHIWSAHTQTQQKNNSIKLFDLFDICNWYGIFRLCFRLAHSICILCFNFWIWICHVAHINHDA